ncbi:SUKH-3 domain-containing protein [uncultured Clostridium sp.]|uniref:SUKH-3 domain-containing protein n=1 Tax=uncultured Clostridium sp. TaxID=59620 RepID=UPI002620907C|nr:SUKH-3 domain-containing protein [uncultured Clostridium sp.]
MNEKSQVILEEAGWYEGRKIDATEWCLYFKRGGIKYLESFRSFFEEFGLLDIKYKNVIFSEKKDDFYSEEQITIPSADEPVDIQNFSYDEKYENEEILVFQKIINEKLMRIGLFGKGNYNLFISESGKFYDDDGLLAENKNDLWDCLIEKDYTNAISYEELQKI